MGVGRRVGMGDTTQFGTDFLFWNPCKWINQGHGGRDRTPVKGKGKGGGVGGGGEEASEQTKGRPADQESKGSVETSEELHGVRR